jgi:metal-sulfur cluster biosynthetic enzyme
MFMVLLVKASVRPCTKECPISECTMAAYENAINGMPGLEGYSVDINTCPAWSWMAVSSLSR